MTCCAPGPVEIEAGLSAIEADDTALAGLSRALADGSRQLEFAVPDAHCAACIRAIETGLGQLPQVISARVNLSRRRVRVVFDPVRGRPSALAEAIRQSGYHTYVLDPTDGPDGDPALRELVKAMAVAGFAAGNVMLFSVSVWAGADAATRDLFHWVSAVIALPAILYSGRIFFRSAWRALRVGRTNMDVPISIGVILATALSLLETLRSAEHAYFDASATLLFFLLVGRTLDHLMRERARSAIGNLARLQPRGATRVLDDGRREYVGLEDIEPGMVLELRAGERVPVDSRVKAGSGLFDNALVTGETMPQAVAKGGLVMAGAGNFASPVEIVAEKPSSESFLMRMAQMMEAAEHARTRPRRIADRAAAIYAPAVHTIAVLTFLGWGLLTGDWRGALVTAIAVLIITCPCALALAVPMVHVVAAGRLFERGILMKDGAALERAAETEAVAFDKTGTLTEGRPRLVDYQLATEHDRAVAGALAAASAHPLARAIATGLGPSTVGLTEVSETPGGGVAGRLGTEQWRLGSTSFCGLSDERARPGMQAWLTRDGLAAGFFAFEDELRGDAAEAVGALQDMRLKVQLISGDADFPVAAAANAVGIPEAASTLRPADKVRAVSEGRTMMVGDGINDAPALRAAHVSMAPATATDIGRTAADFVFTGGRLTAVPFVIMIARRAARLVNQNLVLAIGYNAVAVPLAITGQVTPLIAAVAMSSSSLLVVANALRLRFARPAAAVNATAGAALRPAGAAP